MKSLFHCLAFAAAVAVVAGCASAPDEPVKAAEARNPCTGVAPTTGTMLRKREDCDAEKSRAAMSEQDKDEFRRPTVITAPMPGRSGAAQ